MSQQARQVSRAPDAECVTRWRAVAAMAAVCMVLGACTGERIPKGYTCRPARWSRFRSAQARQVLIVMGTPSTVATLSGEVF